MGRRPPPSVTPEPHIGGARWCEEHGRLECVNQRTAGKGQCHQAVIQGTKSCKSHAGTRTEIAMAKGEAVMAAWAVGQSPTIDPRMAMLGTLQMTYYRMQAYAELLRKQVAKDGEVTASIEDLEAEHDPETGGLIGFRYGAAGKDGRIYVVSEEVRALVALEAAERDRVVRFSEVAHKMGISDRMLDMAERWGDVVAGKVATMLAELFLTPEQEAMVPALVARHLSSIDLADIGGSVRPSTEAEKAKARA
jgi:hypothetical protein